MPSHSTQAAHREPSAPALTAGQSPVISAPLIRSLSTSLATSAAELAEAEIAYLPVVGPADGDYRIRREPGEAAPSPPVIIIRTEFPETALWEPLLFASGADGVEVEGHVPDAITVEDALAAGQLTIEHLMGYETWLDPGNFDDEGGQKRSLSGLLAAG